MNQYFIEVIDRCFFHSAKKIIKKDIIFKLRRMTNVLQDTTPFHLYCISKD